MSTHSTLVHSCARKPLSGIPVETACVGNAGIQANEEENSVTGTADTRTRPKYRQKSLYELDSGGGGLFKVGDEGNEPDSLKIWHKLSRPSLIKSLEAWRHAEDKQTSVGCFFTSVTLSSSVRYAAVKAAVLNEKTQKNVKHMTRIVECVLYRCVFQEWP